MSNIKATFTPQIKGCKGNPIFKHIVTGLIFSCRKDAVVVMGTQRYKKALKAGEFLFNYRCEKGEEPLRITKY